MLLISISVLFSPSSESFSRDRLLVKICRLKFLQLDYHLSQDDLRTPIGDIPKTVDCSERRHEKVVRPKRSPKKERVIRARNPGSWVRKRGTPQDSMSLPGGLVCHNCSQWLIKDHDNVTCSCCPLRFCGGCLLSRYGENIEQELGESIRWVCPRCRGGCGAGCITTCCNCVSCREMLNLQPMGHLSKVARSDGFNNVHDYLVHLETGESAAAIASRKKGRGWTSADSDRTIAGMGQDNSLSWAQKANRSMKFQVKNLKWGNQPGEEPPGKPHKEGFRSTMLQVLVEKPPLLKSTFNLTQKIGPELKDTNQETHNLLNEENRCKWPGSQTEDHLHALEQTEDRGIDLNSEDQFRTPEQTENKCPDLQTADQMVTPKQIENLWWPDFQTEQNMIILEIFDWIMEKGSSST